MVRVLVVAMLLLGGCGGSKADPPAGDTPAGAVVELAGTVTATRGGASRRLARRDPVFADDVVATGADGSIVIELAHNGARWSLEPGMTSRVDESVAWELARETPGDPVGHATSAAGREAERHAADTTVTVGGAAGVEAAKAKQERARPVDREAAAAAAPAAEEPAVTAPSPSASAATNAAAEPVAPAPSRGAASTAERKPAAGRTTRAPSGCDEIDCVIADHPPACCRRFKKVQKGGSRGPRADAAADADAVPERLDQAAIQAGMKAVHAKVRACARPDVKGAVRVKVEVAPDGSVERLTVLETPDAALGTCVAAAVRAARFARSRGGATFTFPFSF